MSRASVAFLGILLAGCASTAPEPVAIRVNDAAQYAADLALCQAAGADQRFRPSLSIGDIAFGAISGGAKSATGAVVGGPLVPAIGAAGGATDAMAQDLDAFGKAGANVTRHCIHDATMQDRSALIADPAD